mgnify:CR=1 FL=1
MRGIMSVVRRWLGILVSALLVSVAARAEEVRENLRVLDKVHGASDLRKKLLASLGEVTSDADALARTLATDNEALASARRRLQDGLRDLELTGS